MILLLLSHAHTDTHSARWRFTATPSPPAAPVEPSFSQKARADSCVSAPAHGFQGGPQEPPRAALRAPLLCWHYDRDLPPPLQVTAWKPCTVGDGTPRRSKLTPSNPEQRERRCPMGMPDFYFVPARKKLLACFELGHVVGLLAVHLFLAEGSSGFMAAGQRREKRGSPSQHATPFGLCFEFKLQIFKIKVKKEDRTKQIHVLRLLLCTHLY